MNIRKAYVRRETETLEDAEAELEGRIFHVTRLAYLPLIVQCKEIRTNANGALPTTFGSSSNSFFRNRNCVSLFDYRLAPIAEIRNFRHRCYPFAPARPPNGPIAVLFLNPEISSALVPWTKWKDEKAWSETVVPYVEAGYPGPLPFQLVAEIISVEQIEDSESLAARLRKARETAS